MTLAAVGMINDTSKIPYHNKKNASNITDYPNFDENVTDKTNSVKNEEGLSRGPRKRNSLCASCAMVNVFQM